MVTTPAFGIQVKKIIHAVGPMPGFPTDFGEAMKLTSKTYRRVYTEAAAENLRTFAVVPFGDT